MIATRKGISISMMTSTTYGRIISLALALTVALLISREHRASALILGSNDGETTEAPVPTTSPDPQSPSTTAASSTTTTTTTTTTTNAPKAASTTTSKPKNLNCVQKCSCTTTKLDCSGRGLTELPKLSGKQQMNLVEFNFSNNSLTTVDLKFYPMARSLDLSRNEIIAISEPGKKQGEIANLTTLNLAQNRLSSASVIAQYKMPALENLNLSGNRFSTFNVSDLNQMPNLKSLNISGNTIHSIQDVFRTNFSQLEKLDLSDNQLVDVPTAVRTAAKIKWLRLDGNLMTSLRPSDLLNKPELETLIVSRCESLSSVDSFTLGRSRKLKELIITNNNRLSNISDDLFEDPTNDQPEDRVELKIFDLRNNNLRTLSRKFQDLNIDLAGNPWDCSCDMQWLINVTHLSDSQPIHCASPVKYKDLEVSTALLTLNCKPGESMMQRFVLVVFLLFLIVLTVAVFVQRADICRRLQWRDQYGTIYYTKARFPMEQV